MGKCACRFCLGSGAVGEVMSLIILTDCGWQDDMRGEYGESICREEHTSALDMTNIIIRYPRCLRKKGSDSLN
jgi:hypothetical protein